MGVMMLVVSCQHEEDMFNGYCNDLVDLFVLWTQHKHGRGEHVACVKLFLPFPKNAIFTLVKHSF